MIPLKVGSAYDVIWDGVLYPSLVAKPDGEFGSYIEYPVDWDWDSGDPEFGFGVYNYTDPLDEYSFVSTNSSDATHTITIIEHSAVIHHLDSKYIKDMYYEEKCCKSVVEEQTLTGFSEMENGIYCVENPFNFAFADGETYIVTWDGVEYECTSEDVEGLLCLGNSNYVFMQKGGDIPFALIYNNALFVAIESTDEVHTISISQVNNVIHHLDPKYIKDMYYEERRYGAIVDDFYFKGSFSRGFTSTTIEGLSLEADVEYTVIIEGKTFVGTTYVQSGTIEFYVNNNGEYCSLEYDSDANCVYLSYGGTGYDSVEIDLYFSLFCETMFAVPIADKYIPDTIARISDVEKIIIGAIGGSY